MNLPIQERPVISDVKQELTDVLDELSNEKLKLLWLFAKFLMETDELGREEIAALNRGIEQFEKGEYVLFDEIKRG